jgi:hypothetical protein
MAPRYSPDAYGDPAEDTGEPGLRIDTVQLGAFDQGVGDVGAASV